MAVPTLDGVAFVEGGDGTAVALSALTTTGAGQVVVAVLTNGNDVTSVTGGGLTFAQRAISTAGDNIAEWVATSSGALSSQVLTCNIGGGGSGFVTAVAFGVKGGNGFDANGSLPASGNADPLSLSTTAAETFVFGAFRYGGTATPSAAASWTEIHAGGFIGVFYRTFTSPQTSLSVPAGGTGVGDANGAVADAIQAAAASSANVGQPWQQKGAMGAMVSM